MSGHSRWTQIKRQKGLADVERGGRFTKYAKLIAVAARRGGDPDMNPTLRTAIETARADNMPIANIERAIKHGTGEDKDAGQIETVVYEGYGPGGVAILVKSLTDNRNRTVAEVRLIFSQSGGNMGEAGSVGWMFEEKGVITVKGKGDEIEMAAIDAGASDLEVSGEGPEATTTIYTSHNDLAKVRGALEKAGIKPESAELSLIAKDSLKITDAVIAKKILDLMEKLEDHDDVVGVYSNFDVDEATMKSLAK